ncbi:MAG TPA: LURP-one-related family protein, partial [Pyrinomonadaceae bacterium]
MRYVMKQKFFSLGDSFAIRNEQGQEVFRAEGKVFSFGDQLTLRDASGEEVAYISQKVFSWGP